MKGFENPGIEEGVSKIFINLLFSHIPHQKLPQSRGEEGVRHEEVIIRSLKLLSCVWHLLHVSTELLNQTIKIKLNGELLRLSSSCSVGAEGQETGEIGNRRAFGHGLPINDGSNLVLDITVFVDGPHQIATVNIAVYENGRKSQFVMRFSIDESDKLFVETKFSVLFKVRFEII